MNYREYIVSKEWYDLKIDLLNKRGCKCEKCDAKRTPTGLHIHHLTYDRLFNELPQDLLILCPKCHAKIHGIKLKKPKRIKVYKPKKQKMSSVIKNYKKRKFKKFSSLIKAIKNAI